ncbi:unnamed protein product [Somion occarium]|uniref:YEATS domain-containing protein n=1 Tax=Somion occarium TaxID=3059160 RepID=A0ABP1DZG4_9APHY
MFYASDEETIVDGRPPKRRKLLVEDDDAGDISFIDPSPRRILLEEVDLEISLRQRLASTVQSRLAWALLLQESSKCAIASDHAESDMKTAALDALGAIEAPCNVLFTREVQALQIAQHLRPVTISNASTPSINPLRAPYTTTTRIRGLNRAVRAPPKKLLFLRNTSTNPPQIVKLACQDCSRTDFSSLQGLLNHCRLRHLREYGSHDDCVQSCAVLIEEDEEQAWVVANGTEVAGISLPGLRRLFEIAVGGGRDLLSLPARPAQSNVVKTEESASLTATPVAEVEPTPAPSIHLTRTLGLHEDTPALAPLLGREPKRRVIHVHDENVDIFSGVDLQPKSQVFKKPNWRMRYAHRSEAQSALMESITSSSTPAPADGELSMLEGEETELAASKETSSTPNPFMRGVGTRFHISARVTIQDRSKWIPPEKRSKIHPDHTHLWRLSVSSPSYSLPIVSFLEKLTVSCITDPPASTLVQPITLDAPPFVLTSTTDRPFLASLRFHWTGRDGLNPPITVEHWVELDPLHLSTPVLGDEQVFDVELDRTTELLLPASREDQRIVTWEIQDSDEALISESICDNRNPNSNRKSDNDEAVKKDHEEGDQKDSSPDPDPAYVVKLKALLPQFPITLKDVKGRPPRQLPYHLAVTPAQFLNLVHGRRKAIEWGRARALHEAYEQSKKDDQGGTEYIALTVSDIYCWLKNEGQFPRTAVTTKISLAPENKKIVRGVGVPMNSSDVKKSTEVYCRRCGLHYLLHPSLNSLGDPVRSQVGGPFFIKRPRESAVVKQEPLQSSVPLPASDFTVLNHQGVCTIFHGEFSEISRPVFDLRNIITLPPSNVRPKEETISGVLPSHSREHMKSTTSSSSQLSGMPQIPASSRDLVAIADPELVRAIQRLSASWNLDRLHGGIEPTGSTANALCLKKLDRPRAEVEDELAPFALLSVLTKCMTRVLLESGLEMFREDEDALKRSFGKSRMMQMQMRGAEERKGEVRRVLTPSHVLRGLSGLESGRCRDVDDVRALTRMVLGTLGMSTGT